MSVPATPSLPPLRKSLTGSWTGTSCWTSSRPAPALPPTPTPTRSSPTAPANCWAATWVRRLVHPNDHVNMGQSSNDVIPTSIHSGRSAIHQGGPDTRAWRTWPPELEKEVRGVLAHCQDGPDTPARRHPRAAGAGILGLRWARRGTASSGCERAQEALAEVALGGTAVGTGVNTHPEFSARACAFVSEAAGVEIRESGNHFQAQSSLDALVEASGELKTVAVSLHKIANDIRFIASGPRAGLGEISAAGGATGKLDNARQGEPGHRGVAWFRWWPRWSATTRQSPWPGKAATLSSIP